MSKISNINDRLPKPANDNGNGSNNEQPDNGNIQKPQPIPLSQLIGQFDLEILGGKFVNDGNIGHILLTFGFLDPKLNGSKISLEVMRLQFQSKNIIIPGRS